MLAIRNTARTSQIAVASIGSSHGRTFIGTIVSTVGRPGGVGVRTADAHLIMVRTNGRLAVFSFSVRRPSIPSRRSWVFSAKPYVCVLS